MNNISYTSAIKAVTGQLDNIKPQTKLPDIPADEFVKSNGAKFKQAVQDAIEFCTSSLKSGKQFEQGYVITRDGDFVCKEIGEELSCRIHPSKLKPHSIVYHSHPHYADDLVPLSAPDVWNLLCNEDVDKVVAVNKHGKTCSLEKKPDFRQMFIKDDTRDEIFEMFEQAWCDGLGIKAEYDDEFIKGLEDAIKQKTGYPDHIFEQVFYNGNKPKRNKAAYKALRASLKYHGLDDSTPARRGFMACGDTIQQIQNEPQGIAIQKMFNERIAERFGLIYEYNK